MSIVTRGTQRPPSGSSLLKAPTRTNGPVSEHCSLAQTWLNRIVQSPGLYFQAYCRWFSRLMDEETYPSPALIARGEEIGPEIARLQEMTMFPTPEMTAAEWTQARDRLEKLWGQRKAIDDRLSERRRLEPRERTRTLRLAGPGSKPSPSPPETTGDPFEME